MSKEAVFYPNADAPGRVDISSSEFERKMRIHFGRIIREERAGMQVHRLGGQLTVHRIGAGLDFRPAVRHSVLQAARFEVVADMAGLRQEVKEAGRTGAFIHDGGKLNETLALRMSGFSPDAYDWAGNQYHRMLRALGWFSPLTLDIAASVAHESIPFMEEILAIPADERTDEQHAQAIMHMLDDQALHDKLASGLTVGEDGTLENQLDRRMRQNQGTDRYHLIRDAGYELYGVDMYEQQRQTGHRVEGLVGDLIARRSGIVIPPMELPVAIDTKLLQRIDDTPLPELVSA